MKVPAECSMEEVDDIFAPPLTSTPRQQPTQASMSFKVPQDLSQPKPGNAAFKTSTRDYDSSSSQDTSQAAESLPARCDHCGFIGQFANHLRESQQCIQAYRAYPEFDIRGNDEEFVTKVCILSKNCPNPSCPGGSHRKIPTQCLSWWIEFGWKNMPWKGVNEDSSSSNIQEKMKQYRKIHWRKTKKEGSQKPSQHSATPTHQDNNTDSSNSVRCLNQLREHGVKADYRECVKCGYRGPLATHLFQSEVCLQAMRRDYLAGGSDHDSPRKIVMDLSLIIQFCPNTACTSTTLGDGPMHHLRGSCGQFIMSEAVAVYKLDGGCDRRRIEAKLRRRASYLSEVLRKAQLLGPKSYQWELSKVLQLSCSRCLVRGHVSAGKEHNMVECVGSLPLMWQCQKCLESQGKDEDIWGQVLAEQQRLSESGHNDVMKAVKIQDGENDRIVFLPPTLAPELVIEESHPLLDPKKTTVLVPQHPDALDIFNEETMDDALKENKSLKRTTEFLSQRIFFSPALEQPLTVMLRKKLAEIKEGRVRMLGGMKSAYKGIVVSRNPNEAKIKERNPHYDATKPNSLTQSCPWSTGHLKQKEDESAAISCANGQLKTRVRLAILRNLAEDSPELAQIMMLVSKQHFNGRIFPLISTAPIVLQFAKAKTDLLIKHVVSLQYSNWDLQVDFKTEEWSVDLMGLLHSAQYNAINKHIAKEGEASMREVVDAVWRKPEVRPICSLDKQWIADHCGIPGEEAEVRRNICFYK